jgi:hypothetical protein
VCELRPEIEGWIPVPCLGWQTYSNQCILRIERAEEAVGCWLTVFFRAWGRMSPSRRDLFATTCGGQLQYRLASGYYQRATPFWIAHSHRGEPCRLPYVRFVDGDRPGWDCYRYTSDLRVSGWKEVIMKWWIRGLVSYNQGLLVILLLCFIFCDRCVSILNS